MTSHSGQSQAADPSTCTTSGRWHEVARQAVQLRRAQQNELELTVLLALLADMPHIDTVIELGYGDGGLSWALRQLPSCPTVLSVSLPASNIVDGQYLPDLHEHIIRGDTHDPATRHEVDRWLAGGRADVLVIDADHTYESARRDWLDYCPFVYAGGLVVFHDIALAAGYPDIQVHRLWAELRPLHRAIEVVAEPTGLAGTGILWL